MTINCDGWRAGYDDQTPEDARAFHAQVYEQFPDQSHFSRKPLLDAVELAAPKTVIEIGGWNGEAAAACLEAYPFIEKWTNVEVCKEAVENSIPTGERYEGISPDDWWFWDREWGADMFVGVHVIEHIKARHLEAAVKAADATWVYFEAPLVDGPIDWRSCTALHILEVGWAGVSAIMTRLGYDAIGHQNLKTPPSSGGFSRAVLWRRA